MPQSARGTIGGPARRAAGSNPGRARCAGRPATCGNRAHLGAKLASSRPPRFAASFPHFIRSASPLEPSMVRPRTNSTNDCPGRAETGFTLKSEKFQYTTVKRNDFRCRSSINQRASKNGMRLAMCSADASIRYLCGRRVRDHDKQQAVSADVELPISICERPDRKRRGASKHY
jgi:hypothetical protein